jgi:hypothetical protein
MREPLKWYDSNATDNPPWIKAIAEVRRLERVSAGLALPESAFAQNPH